jgi:hypothetical protein
MRAAIYHGVSSRVLFATHWLDSGLRHTAPPHRLDVAPREPIDVESRHVRPPDPRWVELWTGRHHQQHTQVLKPVNDPAERLKARGIGPMRILDNHQHRCGPCQRLYLRAQRKALTLMP